MNQTAFRSGLAAILMQLATIAHAQSLTPDSAINTVAGPLDQNIGGQEIGGILEFLALTAIPVVFVIAVLLIVRSSFLLIFEQNEEAIGKTKGVIIGCIAAIMLAILALPIRDALLGIPSGTTVDIVSTEVLGVIAWVEVPVALIAVLVIIISGIRAIISFGNEEGVTQLRRTVLGVMAGIILLVTKFALCGSIVFGTPRSGSCFSLNVFGATGGIIGAGIAVMNVIIGFTALVATAVIMYAGFLMIVNIGNDDQYSKAKSLILRVGIGILVLLSSGAIVNVVAGIGTVGSGFFIF